MNRLMIALDYLLLAIVMAFMVYVILISNAHGAETNYCQRYADRATSDFLQRLNDTQTQDFIRSRLWTTCLNADEAPDLPKTVLETLSIIRPDGPGSACQTASPTSVTSSVAPSAAAPATPRSIATSTPVQAVCTRAHMRTVYSGPHWVCAK